MEPYKGSAEFERIKLLEGHWEDTTTEMTPDSSKPMAIATDYKVTSGGSAVVETLFPGTPHEMVNVYTDEGGKLAMTHYCMMRNQPHMKLTKSSANSLSFEVPAGDPSVAPGADAMRVLTLDTPNPNVLKQTWVSYAADKAKPAPTFTFNRKTGTPAGISK
jgi:hypothetical protein